MVHYYLLDNGVLTNLPPKRHSERNVIAVVSAINHVPAGRSHMFEMNMEDAISELHHKGEKTTMEHMVELLNQSAFIENDVTNPVPICS